MFLKDSSNSPHCHSSALTQAQTTSKLSGPNLRPQHLPPRHRPTMWIMTRLIPFLPPFMEFRRIAKPQIHRSRLQSRNSLLFLNYYASSNIGTCMSPPGGWHSTKRSRQHASTSHRYSRRSQGVPARASCTLLSCFG